jgi:glycosyltransferase involved in cell wall biosynthesis
MRILLFTHIYPSVRYPIRGPYNEYIFRSFTGRHEVRLVGPMPWWTSIREPGLLVSPPHERHTGVDAIFPPYWSVPRLSWMHGRAIYRSLRGRMRRFRRDFPFDVIFAAWGYPDAVAASMFADEYGCPLVIKVLGSDVNEMPADPRLRVQIQRAFNKAHRIIAVSGALRDRVVEMGIPADRVIVQHNAVDGKRFVPRDVVEARKELGLPVDRAVITCVGNLEHVKGIDVLIEAMGELVRGGSDALLAVVGGGTMEPALRARAVELGIEDRVLFLGKRSHSEVPSWIAAGSVLCLPSRMEGCPHVVLEALASGRPVVATAVGGVPELIGPSNGILVPPENPRELGCALAAALGKEWSPTDLRNTVEYLSWEEVGRTYERILLEAAGQTAPNTARERIAQAGKPS